MNNKNTNKIYENKKKKLTQGNRIDEKKYQIW